MAIPKRTPALPFRYLWRDLKTEEKQALAAALGVTFHYLSGVANGSRVPSESMVRRISEECGAPTEVVREERLVLSSRVR